MTYDYRHRGDLAAADLLSIIKVHVSFGTHVMTDEAGHYAHVGKHFAAHDFTRHGAGEYVRGIACSNTVEGFYSVFNSGPYT